MQAGKNRNDDFIVKIVIFNSKGMKIMLNVNTNNRYENIVNINIISTFLLSIILNFYK